MPLLFLRLFRPNRIRTSALPKGLFSLRFAPVGAEHALVAAVAPFGVVFGCLEQFCGFGGELLHYTRETNLALQEVLELIPHLLLYHFYVTTLYNTKQAKIC